MRQPINVKTGYPFGAMPYPLRILNPDGTVFGWKHGGQDYPANQGTQVVAPHAGKIVMADWNGSAGKEVRIVGANGFVSRLLHLQHTAVSVGQTVKEGQLVGLSGNTGFSTGPHLHWGLSINGKYVNPLLYVTPPKPPAPERIAKKGTATVTTAVLNVRNSPSTTAKIQATYKKGEKFNYDSYIDTNGYRWLSYISVSSKTRRYVAQRKLGGESYVSGGV
jgi:murein DD-endopeptidase MepM/ murein hydrolase activator NlpD